MKKQKIIINQYVIFICNNINIISNIWSNNCIEYESNSEEIKQYQLKNILIKLDHCLKDIINNLKKSDTWKIQLAIAHNFISSIDNDEECAKKKKKKRNLLLFMQILNV